jgi:hypothetical protein
MDQKEFNLNPHDLHDNEILYLISDEHECEAEPGIREGFVQWLQGFTPKEHREMLDRERALMQERTDRKASWVREDARDAAMSTREDERDAATISREALYHRHELIVFGWVLGGISLVGSIIGGWIGSGREIWPF